MKHIKKTIFFVDDETDICRVVKKILISEGYKVSCFLNAKDCIEKSKKEYADCIITDMNMPELNGISLLEEIRKLFPEKPVLMITGYADIPIAVRCMQAGATDFIEKPLDRNVLLEKIESVFNRPCRISNSIRSKLSNSELIVLEMVLSGKSSNSIASLLNCSVRTIEDNRYKVMKKLKLRNVVELAKAALVID